MSIWNVNKDGPNKAAKVWYTKWPDPTKNFVKDMRILACQHTFQAKLEFATLGAAHFFWGSFVPQPNEIVRKTATGSYKCGFYLGMKFPSPLELVFDTKTVTAFAEMIRPATTALWFMWAMSSAWDALSQWQQMMGMVNDCEDDHSECLLRDGTGDLFAADPAGSPGFYTAIYDPFHMYASPGGGIDMVIPQYIVMDAHGQFVTGGTTVEWVEIYFIKGGTEPIPGSSVFRAGDLNPGSVVEWTLSYSGQHDPGTFQIYIRAHQTAVGLQHSRIDVNRWTATTWDKANTPQCGKYKPSPIIA